MNTSFRRIASSVARTSFRPVGTVLIAVLGFQPEISAGIVPDGVNLQPSYYNNGNVNLGFTLMNANSRIGTCRIEIEPDKVTQAKTWISQARSNGKTVIATYHKSSVLGSDSTSELTAAANWWRTNYSTLNASGSFTLNLSNEWGSHNISNNSFASAYNSAISTVRQVYSGRIIVDIPGWGQETRTAAEAVLGTGGTRINDTNIALSVHIYPGAWNQGRNRYLTNADLDEMGNAGRPCIVGEFGNSGGSGADWSGLTDYARGKGWTLLGWAWNGDGGSMNMCNPSWASNSGATSFTKSSYFDVVYNKLAGGSGGGGGGGGTTTVLHNFESNTEGWVGSNHSGGPWQANEFTANGSYGLKADVSLSANKEMALYRATTYNFTGKTSLQIRVRHAAWGTWNGAQARIYVKTGSSYSWFNSNYTGINSSGATTLTLSLSGVSNLGDVREIGVQYRAGGSASGGSSIYLDYATTQ